MKEITLFITIFFVFSNIYSQNNNIFFINGQYSDTRDKLSDITISSKNEEEEVMIYFNSLLLRLDSDSLTIIDTLAHFSIDNFEKKEKLHSIRLYQDKNSALIYTSISNNETIDTISLRHISFDNPYKNQTTNFLHDPLYKYWIIYKNDSLFIINKEINKKTSFLTKRSFQNQNEFVEGYDILNYYISDGYNGLGCDDLYGGWGTNTERIELYRKIIGNKSVFVINNKIIDLPITDELIKLDTSFFSLVTNKNIFALTISNNDMYVLFKKPQKNNNEWYSKFYIFNKKQNKWLEKYFKGSYAAIRAFNNWIVGNQTYIGRLGINGESTMGKEVPGKKFRNQEYSEFTSPADFRFQVLEIYPTGILYMYNIDNDKYIEWQATEENVPQGDSEILLVKNNTVFYRINDKIYKRLIKEGSILGEEELLIQDDRVPSIHWAFIKD